MKRKCLAIGIILLFVGVTIAPTISQNVVTASRRYTIRERIKHSGLQVIAFQQITNQLHKQILSLKSLVKTPPQRQFIILSIYLIGLILIIPYLIFWASVVINPTPGFIILLTLIGIFWPISLIIFFFMTQSEPYLLGKYLQNHQQSFSHLLSVISPSITRGIHA